MPYAVRGCVVLNRFNRGDFITITASGAEVKLYGTKIYGGATLTLGTASYTLSGEMINCEIYDYEKIDYYSSGFILQDVDIDFTDDTWGFIIHATPGTQFVNVRLFKSDSNALKFPDSGTYTIKDIEITDNTSEDIEVDDAETVNMINSVFDNTKVDYITQAYGWTLWKKYTFDAKVKFGVSAIQNARNVLWNKDDTLEFNVLTDGSGDIAQQEVKAFGLVHGAGSGSVTVTNYNDFLYRIYKYGYQPYDVVMTMGAAIDATRFLTDDDFITEATEATVEAYTGITINHGAETITISENHTLNEIYDFIQDDIADNPQVGFAKVMDTSDGVNFTCRYDFIINTGITVTATDLKLTMATGKTYTLTGTAEFTGIIADQNKSRVHLTVTVKDSAGSAIVGARLLVEADAGGDAPHGDSVSITRSGSTATVTHTAHGLNDGEMVVIRGANQPEYNKVTTITYINVNSYSYTVSGTPATPATGTITATQVFMNELTVSGGIATEPFEYTAGQPFTAVARKASGSPYYEDAAFTGSISTTGLDVIVQLGSDE